MLHSWLLAFGFLLFGGAFICCAAFAGGLVLQRRPEQGALELLWRTACGLALYCFSTSLLGVLGVLFTFPAILILVVLSLLGFWRNPILMSDFQLPQLHPLVILLVILLGYNVLIGAMVSDMSQDSMWYHLSVPQQ